MRSLPRRALRASALACLSVLVFPACDAFDGSRSDANEGASESAQVQVGDDVGFGLVLEQAHGGAAATLGLIDVRWGRRVDLWALDPELGHARPWLAGVVVGPDPAVAAGQVERDLSLGTGRERLVIQHPLGSARSLEVLAALEAELRPFDGAVLPANAALSLRFDDLLDPARLAAGVALLVDGEPVAPRRLELDGAHGVAHEAGHRSARAVLELAPQRTLGGGSLALVVDGVTNLAGAGLGAPVVRSAALGDESALLGNGVPPFVVGRLDGQLTQVVAGSVPGFFQVEFVFGEAVCAFAPQVGDTLETATHFAHVIAPGGPPQGASTGRLRVQLVGGDPATFAPAAAQLRARWDAALGAPPACFVRFTPAPGAAPAADVSTAATVTVEFSVPMAPGSVQSTGTWTLSQAVSSGPLGERVSAAVAVDPTLTRYTLAPILPLRHRQGQAEALTLRLVGGVDGVVDTGLTPLEQVLPEIVCTLDPGEPSTRSDGLSFTFPGLDEDGDGLADLRGQAVFDLPKGLTGGRPVTRFSGTVDGSQPLVAAMSNVPIGVQSPLVPQGARQMTTWRYVDMGFGLLDDAHHNLDVEGLHWAPFQSVFTDFFSSFQLSLAHGFFLPDETVDAGLLPAYRFSGVVPTFDANLLDGLTVVNDKTAGYGVSSADSFVGPTGTLLQPWPLNFKIPVSQYVYWTWRDTAVVEIGGAGTGTTPDAGVGADPQRLGQVTGNPGLPGFYPQAKIPSIAEPLLMEFRTYPDPNAAGFNPARISIAINSSYRPTFRAYSAGGIDSQGNTVLVDPDNEPVAQGGFTPGTGQKTGPIDNVVHWGQADFVVRVSRAHTRWLDTGGAHDFAGQFVVEPGLFGLPPGTDVELAFRGASSVSASAGSPWLDATLYDPYGDGYTQAQLDLLYGLGVKTPFDVVEFPVDDDKRWHASLDDLDGARWVQVRVTYLSNPRTLSVPQSAGFAIAWQ